MLKASPLFLVSSSPIDSFWLIFQCQWVMQNFQRCCHKLNFKIWLLCFFESYLRWRPCLIFNHPCWPPIYHRLYYFSVTLKANQASKNSWGWRNHAARLISGLCMLTVPLLLYNRFAYIYPLSVSRPPQYRILCYSTTMTGSPPVTTMTAGSIILMGELTTEHVGNGILLSFLPVLLPSFQPLPHLYLAAYSETSMAPQPLVGLTFQSTSCFLTLLNMACHYNCPLYWSTNGFKPSVLLPSIMQNVHGNSAAEDIKSSQSNSLLLGGDLSYFTAFLSPWVTDHHQ